MLEWSTYVGIIAEECNIDIDKITKDSVFMENLGIDSQEVMGLLCTFEKRLNIKVNDDTGLYNPETGALNTVGDIYDLVSSLVGESSEA